MAVYYVSGFPYSDELYHYGRKNQKWGVRLYQYENGSYTPLGRIHYGLGAAKEKIAKVRAEYKENARQKKERIKEAKRREYLRNNPDQMTDEEIRQDITRLNLERQREEADRALTTSRENAQKAKDDLEGNASDLLKKDYKKMTNEELKQATERLIAEKKYEDAMREYEKATKKESKVRKVVGDILESGGKALATKGFNKLADKLFEDDLEASKRAKQLAENLKYIRDNTPIKELKLNENTSEASNKQIEDYKNRLIDLKQIKYLENEVNSPEFSSKENTDSYKKTDRNGSDKNNNNGGNGKKNNNNNNASNNSSKKDKKNNDGKPEMASPVNKDDPLVSEGRSSLLKFIKNNGPITSDIKVNKKALNKLGNELNSDPSVSGRGVPIDFIWTENGAVPIFEFKNTSKKAITKTKWW